MPETISIPETRTAHITQDQDRWRTYLFELEGVEPWAVVPLVKRVRELVEFHSAGDLEYEYDTAVELKIRFTTVERTDEPKYGFPWGKAIDEELMLGSGWRCVKTKFADGSTIDETEVATQRQERANREDPLRGLTPPATSHRYAIVTPRKDVTPRQGVVAAEAITKAWDESAFVSVDARTITVDDDTRVAVVVMVDNYVTNEELEDLAGTLWAIGAVDLTDDPPQ